MEKFYWTDSQVVLGYLKNDIKQFKVFVANRIQFIRGHSNIGQWHYVNTAENPVHFASRWLNINQKNKVEKWFQVPAFLWQNQDTWDVIETIPELSMDDPEVKRQVVVNAVWTSWNDELLSRILKATIDWNKLKRITTFVIKFVQQLKNEVELCWK